MNMPTGMTGSIGGMSGMSGIPMGMPMGGMPGIPGIQSPVAKIKEQIDLSKTILIVTHESPTSDSIGASLAMYLGLTSLGKQAVVACPDPMRVELSSFVGANKVTDSIAKRNFIVSLDYTEGMIEKVSYNIEGDKFNLVVETREGFEPFSPDKVSYNMAGSAADLIIAIDTIHLGGLKSLYETQKDLFAGKTIINIDRHPNNTQYGTINFHNAVACSTSELVAEILSGIGVKLSTDIATNLLNGIYGATNNFSIPTISPRAFEVAAVCTRAGGKRFVSSISGQPHTPVTEVETNDPRTISEVSNVGNQSSIHQQSQFQQKTNQQSKQQIPSFEQTNHTSHDLTQVPMEQKKNEVQIDSQTPINPFKPQFTSGNNEEVNEKELKKTIEVKSSVKSQRSTPDDWLKPKIFKSRDVN
jgi:hypothetical protein